MVEQQTNPLIKKAVPILLILFVFCLIVDNSFKVVSVDMAKDLGISASTVSWQATLAGLFIGIGAVIYAALADFINIRKLLVIGIVLICIGSIMGFIFQQSFPLVVISRIIQTSGLAAAETLYVIFVTKHLPLEQQKKFLGFSTSCFAISQVVGALAAGYISTYLNWTGLFILPLATIIILPFILKYVPKEEQQKGYIDVIGLFLVGITAAALMMYVSSFNWLYLLGFIIALGLFLFYIAKAKKAFIQISFFQDKHFISILLVAFVIYSVQLAYIFMFPFVMESIFHIRLDIVSLLLIPAYVLSAIVGAFSGSIAKYLSSKQAISTAIVLIGASVLLAGLAMGSYAWIFVISMIVFSSSFALMYAPMIDAAIRTIPTEKTGTAVGFYNLILNVAASVGIAYTAALMDNAALNKTIFSYIQGAQQTIYSNTLFVLTIIALVSLLLYWTFSRRTPKQVS
ncbi:MFS transporter [Ornithinibacillus gellani]|uniref:MFS transporter n=1 Tax=Ornithinibacillus gellani TaxID=2293253 RepID=UPI000F46F8E1|nr:MFS transporter [Ornithinibacillus gellani]TQS71869.1 MFS transporter [Ornithinibacillus gellani]